MRAPPSPAHKMVAYLEAVPSPQLWRHEENPVGEVAGLLESRVGKERPVVSTKLQNRRQ